MDALTASWPRNKFLAFYVRRCRGLYDFGQK